MRYARSLAAACTTAALLWIVACSHHPVAPARFPLADSTRANALSAMHGEAMAHAKYLAYAAQAQQAGRGQAAQQFASAAHTELSDHFAREADLIGLGGDIAANLRDAISDETNEATHVSRTSPNRPTRTTTRRLRRCSPSSATMKPPTPGTSPPR